MTPTASRLQLRLEDRRLWFINEWFFKWHRIGKDGPVTIDSFDGRGIHYGGIKFNGSARLVYWQTIVRGVRKEIDAQFAWIDQDVRNYNRQTALTAIAECARQLTGFVNSIRHDAMEKDRILRGDGFKFPDAEDGGRWEGLSSDDIQARAEALKEALPSENSGSSLQRSPTEVSWRNRASQYWNENQWWLGWFGLAVGIAGLVPLFLA